MSGGEDFDDFLARRKPLFRPTEEDLLEPPESLDRIVLRQAREAIQPPREMQEIRSPGWGMPLALAATLLVAFTVVLNVATPRKSAESTANVQQVAERRDAAVPPAAPENLAQAKGAVSEARAASNDVRVPVSADEPERDAAPAPALVSSRAESPPRLMPESARGSTPTSSGIVMQPPNDAERIAAKASAMPAWRRDAQSWLAEIDRLRAAGKTAEADAEMTEYKRQHRAYATSPDR